MELELVAADAMFRQARIVEIAANRMRPVERLDRPLVGSPVTRLLTSSARREERVADPN
jgi:hypothetical protein